MIQIQEFAGPMDQGLFRGKPIPRILRNPIMQQYSRSARYLLCLLLVGNPSLVLGDVASKPLVLPETCQTECVTPYNQVLGTAPGEVPAYSNCSSSCVVFAPNTQDGVYTGIQWQCVEFARRWLLDNLGVVYGDVDVAANIWTKIDSVTRVADDASIPLLGFENGSGQAPELGDLLIYGQEFLNTGHVAVITEVDLAAGKLRVAEQNYRNEPWPADYAREIDLIERNGRYWVLDAYVLGWKRVQQ